MHCVGCVQTMIGPNGHVDHGYICPLAHMQCPKCNGSRNGKCIICKKDTYYCDMKKTEAERSEFAAKKHDGRRGSSAGPCIAVGNKRQGQQAVKLRQNQNGAQASGAQSNKKLQDNNDAKKVHPIKVSLAKKWDLVHSFLQKKIEAEDYNMLLKSTYADASIHDAAPEMRGQSTCPAAATETKVKAGTKYDSSSAYSPMLFFNYGGAQNTITPMVELGSKLRNASTSTDSYPRLNKWPLTHDITVMQTTGVAKPNTSKVFDTNSNNKADAHDEGMEARMQRVLRTIQENADAGGECAEAGQEDVNKLEVVDNASDDLNAESDENNETDEEDNLTAAIDSDTEIGSDTEIDSNEEIEPNADLPSNSKMPSNAETPPNTDEKPNAETVLDESTVLKEEDKNNPKEAVKEPEPLLRLIAGKPIEEQINIVKERCCSGAVDAEFMTCLSTVRRCVFDTTQKPVTFRSMSDINSPIPLPQSQLITCSFSMLDELIKLKQCWFSNEPISALDLKIERSPIECPDTTCNRLTFVSDLNKHLVMDHNNLAIERISTRQCRTCFIDPRVSDRGVNKCHMLYLIKNKITELGSNEYSSLYPILLMSAPVNLPTVLQYPLQVPPELMDKKFNDDMFMVWTTGIVAPTLPLTVCLTVWPIHENSPNHRVVHTGQVYNIRDSQNVVDIWTSGKALILSAEQMQKMTKGGTEMIAVQIIVY